MKSPMAPPKTIKIGLFTDYTARRSRNEYSPRKFTKSHEKNELRLLGTITDAMLSGLFR
jgi:hypothetical protein